VVRVNLRSIIGCALALLCALVLGGCSVLRVGYSQAPMLAHWWIDSYVDLTDAQSQPVREAIERWFDWHRRSEMPRYAALLVRAQREVLEPKLTPVQLCAWRDEAQRRLEAGLEQATPALAELIASLSPEQIRHLERKLAKDGEELRSEFAQGDRGDRAKASYKRTLERYENLYGRLDDAQRARLGELLASSPFDADRWLAERERRNRDLVATLSSVVAAASSGTDRAAVQAQGQAAVRLVAERMARSPRADYRAYQERLTQENCALAATMHNLTTAAQRQYARDKLKGWDNDVRLIANGNGNGVGSDAPGMGLNPR
jgi:hypothetical protein